MHFNAHFDHCHSGSSEMGKRAFEIEKELQTKKKESFRGSVSVFYELHPHNFCFRESFFL